MTLREQPRLPCTKLKASYRVTEPSDSGDQSKREFRLCPSKPGGLAHKSCQSFEGGGVVKSLRGFACGPVGLVRTQYFGI